VDGISTVKLLDLAVPEFCFFDGKLRLAKHAVDAAMDDDTARSSRTIATEALFIATT
jgi:hypothetical protein